MGERGDFEDRDREGAESLRRGLPRSKELEELEMSDPLRQILQMALNKMLSAEADAICGAPYGMPSPDRTNHRNGYRQRVPHPVPWTQL